MRTGGEEKKRKKRGLVNTKLFEFQLSMTTYIASDTFKTKWIYKKVTKKYIFSLHPYYTTTLYSVTKQVLRCHANDIKGPEKRKKKRDGILHRI